MQRAHVDEGAEMLPEGRWAHVRAIRGPCRRNQQIADANPVHAVERTLRTADNSVRGRARARHWRSAARHHARAKTPGRHRPSLGAATMIARWSRDSCSGCHSPTAAGRRKTRYSRLSAASPSTTRTDSHERVRTRFPRTVRRPCIPETGARMDQPVHAHFVGLPA
jgi:hypothetical protein